MNIQNLVEMANDIAQYFEFGNEHDEAVNSVATHLHKYWEIRMRREIVAHVEAGGKGLEPVARDAVIKMGALDQPAAA